ncbi:MAG: hypothetical protein KAS47_08445, partial [Candidatus Heimdallarchaeota archaeon]|nr:hypothetical protein [Candidatus Heimdallarchaeota archaeon]
ITPINRSITNDMSELSREEKILYIDNVPSASGVAYGNDGILWITEERIFVQMPGKQIYARPIFTIDSYYVNENNILTIIIKSKDGIAEENEINTSSDPSIIVNILDFIKRYK